MNTGNFDTKQRQSINSSDLNRSAKALNSKMVNGVFQVNYFVSFPNRSIRVLLLFTLPDMQCNLFQEQFIRDLIDYIDLVKRWKNVKSNGKALQHVKIS